MQVIAGRCGVTAQTVRKAENIKLPYADPKIVWRDMDEIDLRTAAVFHLKKLLYTKKTALMVFFRGLFTLELGHRCMGI